MSHALYGTVKITCYDRVHESRGGASGGASAGASLRQFATQTFGGGSGRSSGRQSDQAVLHRSAWHEAPHTSCLTPHKANIHRLEAGHQGTGSVILPAAGRTIRKLEIIVRKQPIVITARLKKI